MERHLTPKHNGRSEKDKMFSNELYRPSDAELVQDRERCKAALWRFINAGNPLYAISADERTRLLREVFVPAGQRKGSLGPGTIIEAPFNCHYGYNINIGTDVFISQNCLIVDDCGVSIGANTWIGPNVTILSAQAAPEMQERKGTQICYRGSPVMIYMDCYIGAGVTILPGTIIGRGVSIAPGQIVSGRITDYDTIGTIPQF
jgi:acetyltransferase-like isoleucine patch superfamily enzyme